MGVVYQSAEPVTFAGAYAMLDPSGPAQTVSNLTAHAHLLSALVLSYFVNALGRW